MEQQNMNKILEIMKAKTGQMNINHSVSTSGEKYSNQMSFSLLESVIPFMELAEQLGNYTGVQKKDFVIENVKEYARKANALVNEKQIGDLIEDLIRLTKKVNI